MNFNKSKFFLTSDIHFFHNNIIKYCNRPFEMTPEGLNKMNESICQEFDKLPDDDETFVLNNGDLCMNSKIHFEDLIPLVNRMKGEHRHLWIILGNHDRDVFKYIKKESGEKFTNPTDFFVELGFERVYQFPILIDDMIFSHEPVYLSPGNNLNNVYGHTHNILIDKDYFNRDCENWAMMERVKKEGLTKQTNLDIDTKIKYNDKTIRTENYYNICWDNLHRITTLSNVKDFFKRRSNGTL